jgi:hypothetical protein
MYTTEDEARKVVYDEATKLKIKQAKFAQREIWALSTATCRRVYDGKKIYGLRAKWFFSLSVHPNYVNRENIGIGFLIVASWFFTFLLLLFLW